MFLVTLLLAAAPSVLLLTYFYLRDQFDREPLGHLFITFGLGMFAMFAAQGAGLAVMELLPVGWLDGGSEGARLFDAFIVAGAIEDASRYILLLAAVYHWKEFDEPMDGLIYGVTLALGFATLENYFYLSRFGVGLAWQRAVFAVPAHALFGGTMGFYLGKNKFGEHTSSTRALNLVLALVLPILFHGAYDYALSHKLDRIVWVCVSAISGGMWLFVLRRVKRAQKASPFRPKTMIPAAFMVGTTPGRASSSRDSKADAAASPGPKR